MKTQFIETKKIDLGSFSTNKGVILEPAEACYTLYGDLENGKKLALFFHGFSSNSEMHNWWAKFPIELVSQSFNILCINALGSCHGSCGPDSINAKTGKSYKENFPKISMQDTVDFTAAVLSKLKIQKLDYVFGCSLGGMQALDMFVRYPEYAEKYIAVCASPLTLMTKIASIAQAKIISDGIKLNLSEDELRSRMGLSRLFFRMACTTEKALSKLQRKLSGGENSAGMQPLEDFFLADSFEFENAFSPYSFNLYSRMLIEFELDLSKCNGNTNSELVLIDISEDQFTSTQKILEVMKALRKKARKVRRRKFKTDYGHEAWIIDGERFYDFIKVEFNI